MKKVIHILIFLIITLFDACREDDFLDGYDRNTLFAPPSQSELDEIRSDWNFRDLSVKGYVVEEEIAIANLGATLKIVSFIVGEYREYAALLVPDTGDDLPVRIYVGGFDIGQQTN